MQCPKCGNHEVKLTAGGVLIKHLDPDADSDHEIKEGQCDLSGLNPVLDYDPEWSGPEIPSLGFNALRSENYPMQ